MLFDKLCTLYERNEQMKKLIGKEILDSVKIFYLDGKLPVTDKSDDIFVLPYNDVAFEYKVLASNGRIPVNNCIIFSGTDDSAEVNGMFYIMSEYPNPMNDMRMETVFMTGTTYNTPYKESVGELTFASYVRNKDELFHSSLKENIATEFREWFHTIFNYTIEVIKTISNPKLFVIEEQLMKPFKVGKKIARSHQQAKYTVLNLKQIQKRYNLTGTCVDGTGRTVHAHPRRAYVRTLRNERFGNNVGKKIKVKSTWVGDTEAKIGNKIYKVLLDD